MDKALKAQKKHLREAHSKAEMAYAAYDGIHGIQPYQPIVQVYRWLARNGYEWKDGYWLKTRDNTWKPEGLA